jgi:hypothetical protein
MQKPILGQTTKKQKGELVPVIVRKKMEVLGKPFELVFSLTPKDGTFHISKLPKDMAHLIGRDWLSNTTLRAATPKRTLFAHYSAVLVRDLEKCQRAIACNGRWQRWHLWHGSMVSASYTFQKRLQYPNPCLSASPPLKLIERDTLYCKGRWPQQCSTTLFALGFSLGT